MFLIFSLFNMSTLLCRNQTVNEVTVRLSSHQGVVKCFEYMQYMLFIVRWCVVGIGFNDLLILHVLMALVCTFAGMSLSNIMYWAFRPFDCFFYLIVFWYIINYFLKFFVNVYHQYAECMFSIQIWIPLIFLYILFERRL